MSVARGDTEYLDVFILAMFSLCAYAYWLGTVPVRFAFPALITIVVAQCAVGYHRHRDLFHPSVFMLGYLATVALGPISYMALTGNALSRISMSNLHQQTGVLMVASVGSWMFANVAYSLVNSRTRSEIFEAGQLVPPGSSLKLVESVGRVLLVGALLLKIAQVLMFAGRSYGEAQTTFDLFFAVSTAAEGVLLVAIAAVAYGRSHTGGTKLLASIDWVLLVAIFVLAGALLGSRSELIAPSLLLLWFYSRNRRLRARFLILLLPVVLTISNYIGNTRGSGLANSAELGTIGRWLVDVASPTMISNDLVWLRNFSNLPLMYFDTYIAAVQYMLPGFIARNLFSGLPGTGAFIYRDVIQFDDPDAGFGFSQFSEAYLAGGILGAVLFFFGLSFVSLWSYRRAASHQSVFSQLFFPLILSTFPYGLRSDALGFGKSVIYPLIIVSLITITARTVSNRELRTNGN